MFPDIKIGLRVKKTRSLCSPIIMVTKNFIAMIPIVCSLSTQGV